MKTEDIANILLKERINLSAFIVMITKDYHAAEDIFQEVCVAAISQSERFNDRQELYNWSKKVARNKAIDVLRRKQKSPIMDDSLLDLLEIEFPISDDVNLVELHDALKNCIHKLTPNNQIILDLRYTKGYSGKDVAKYLQRNVETVYKALSRIHNFLRNCIYQQKQQDGVV